MPQLKLVSEEIVRWAFEVSLKSCPQWRVAFTNPTAGPWKRVMGEDASGRVGEVHRFEIDEKRPDLIIYSDEFETVVIVEAKTDLRGLADQAQVEKTSALFHSLNRLLHDKSSNPFWGIRANYRYELGMLWGKKEESYGDIRDAIDAYLTEGGELLEDILCIQGQLNTSALEHKVFWGASGENVTLEDYQR